MMPKLILKELARYDTSEPAQKPGKRGKAPPKAKGAKGFLSLEAPP